MKVNISVDKYKNYLQHRDPMVWVDRVVEAGKNEDGIFGSCRVLVSSSQLFLQNNNKIRGSAAVEFVAQAYGFVRACYQDTNNIPYLAKRTFLTGIRSCSTQFSEKIFQENEELLVEIQTVRELYPLFFIRGRVFNTDKTEEYAVAEIQLYIGE